MTAETLSMSPEQLREKYLAERDKRMRDDGAAQYRDPAEVFENFDADPYIDQPIEREPLTEECEVAIVGAGFGGMMAAVELTRKDVRDIRIIDKGGDFGGTWYWNRYPGARCDVESYIYLPYLEETGYMPEEKYATANEIFRHCQRIAEHFDLYPMGLFQTHVDELTWQEDRNRWKIVTNRGDVLHARFVVVAGGILHKAKLPGTPGLGDFQGHMFHTSRWDYDYTGGGPGEPMDKLADKTVAIVGTGATGVQAVPSTAEFAKKLYVVQRTPSGVGVRANRPTDPEWAKSLEPGWQQQRMDNFTSVVSGKPAQQDMVNDGWTQIFHEIGAFGVNPEGVSPEDQQLADYRAMEDIRKRISDAVTDESTAEALKPWYNRMCKRPCFHDEYLETFNRPNVELLDTDGEGLERVTPTGIVVQGKEYDVDCLIFASGFEISTDYNRRLGFDVVGRDGRSMSQEWLDPGPHTVHGIFAEGFPNLAMFSLVQGTHAINFVHSTLDLAKHTAWTIDAVRNSGHTVVEATKEGEEEWWNEVMQHLMGQAQFLLDCTPGYYNQEGARDMSRIKTAAYMGGTMAYIDILRDWRAKGSLDGLELKG